MFVNMIVHPNPMYNPSINATIGNSPWDIFMYEGCGNPETRKMTNNNISTMMDITIRNAAITMHEHFKSQHPRNDLTVGRTRISSYFFYLNEFRIKWIWIQSTQISNFNYNSLNRKQFVQTSYHKLESVLWFSITEYIIRTDVALGLVAPILYCLLSISFTLCVMNVLNTRQDGIAGGVINEWC